MQYNISHSYYSTSKYGIVQTHSVHGCNLRYVDTGQRDRPLEYNTIRGQSELVIS